MNYILFDDNTWEQLLPLTFTRPVSYIRVGIDTVYEKWESYLGASVSFHTRNYLRTKFPLTLATDNILINSSIIPDEKIIVQLSKLDVNDVLIDNNIIIAARLRKDNIDLINNIDKLNAVIYNENYVKINNTWDIFSLNGELLEIDYNRIIKDKKSESLNNTVNIIGDPHKIFIEKGVTINYATLNTTNGSIFIGKNSEIMEGSIIRGPFAIGEHSTIKIGAKIYGPTTIGPYCKAGGELNNVVMFGYSNKGHDGFLGNAVLGEWCNIGADSNNSNLKNNYSEVKFWSYIDNKFAKTGLQFCGLIMGDHSKCGINTMFNTGTMIGVSANIFGTGFPRNFVPSFSWGGAAGFSVYRLNKVFEVAELVMSRRDVVFDNIEEKILEHVFELTKQYRTF